MKKLNEKRIARNVFAAMVMVFALASMTFAAADTFDNVYVPIVNLLNSLLGPALAIVGAVGALYCVILGVKFAKAEEPQDREKAKTHLKNAIIGFVLVFILILALNLLLPIMKNWVDTELANRGGQAIFGEVTTAKP